MPDLIAYSRAMILRHQQPSGAYPACPTMPDYQFCWFRDGSFIAHAMLLSQEYASAAAFHRWAARTILRFQEGARRAMQDVSEGKTPNPHDVLRARYTYDSGKGPDDWPEFQLDGLGTWLWAVTKFVAAGRTLDDDVWQAFELVADYLVLLWPLPCHDLWEEFGDRVHTYTLSAMYGGLMAAADHLNDDCYAENATEIKRRVMTTCVSPDLSFVKFPGADLVDGALTALATPYRLVAPNDPILQNTIKRIEADLYVPDRGVHRYRGDSYYGGGAWLLLASWLGWHYAESGETAKGRTLLEAMARHATPSGDLPEQVVPPMLTTQADYDHWVRVRGPIAMPLLWSHAMQIVLDHALR